MMYRFFFLFLIFFIYSVIGYIVEIINVSIIDKKVVLNRGFLIGPYLPIYGFGSLFMTLFLTRYQGDVFVLFIMSVFICSTLEYLTSFVMEKIFKLRWWDYSDRKFNINGRVCLENGFLFGIGGVAIIEMSNPIIIKFIYSLPSSLVIYGGLVLFIIILTDFILSSAIVFRIRVNVSKYVNKDATSAVRKEVQKTLHKYSYLTTRIFEAFPDISSITAQSEKSFKAFKQGLFEAKEEMNKLKMKYNKKRDKLKRKYNKKYK